MSGSEGGAGFLRLARAVGGIASAHVAAEAPGRPLIGTVVDARPASLSVQLEGYADPVEVTASDLFDLFPLEHEDLVIAIPLAGGTWHVIDRLHGAPPEVSLSRDDLDGIVSAGPGLYDNDGTPGGATVQALRKSQAWPLSATTDYTWAFDQPFDQSPFVVAQIEGTSANIFDLQVRVKSVTDSAAVLSVKNVNVAAVTASVVALAVGAG